MDVRFYMLVMIGLVIMLVIIAAKIPMRFES